MIGLPKDTLHLLNRAVTALEKLADATHRQAELAEKLHERGDGGMKPLRLTS